MSFKVKGIPWDTIERDYRCGILSLREIATKNGNITESAIRKRAKRDDWARDLNARIHARADELVRKQAVRSLVRTSGTLTDKQRVESLGLLEADVRVRHKTTIARAHALCHYLLAELEAQSYDNLHAHELAKLMRNPDGAGMDRLNDIYKKVISTPGRVDTTKKLVDAMKSLVTMEREAYGISCNNATETPANSLAAFLAGMKRSTLPVVEIVERDDSL